MRFDTCVWIAACGLMVAGCLNKKNTDDAPPPPSETAPVQTVAATTVAPTAAAPANLVKGELDNRSDGITGVPIAVPGVKAIIQAPHGWQLVKGETQVATSADQKARVAAAPYGVEGPSAKLDKASAAGGLSGCQWAPADAVTVGKDKLHAQAADGTCTRSGAPVKAAYMATEGLLEVGSWDNGGDQTSVFGSMRSVSKAVGGGDASGIAACCQAIQQTIPTAPPQHQPLYISALAACNAAKTNPQGRAALAGVRAMLPAANVPGACK